MLRDLLHINKLVPSMLTDTDMATAERLLTKLREIVEPAPPEYLRAKELCALLNCLRTQAWILSRSAGFPAPLILSERLRLWPRRAVLEWMQSRTAQKRDARPKPGADIDLDRTLARGKRAEPTTDNPHDMPHRRARQRGAR